MSFLNIRSPGFPLTDSPYLGMGEAPTRGNKWGPLAGGLGRLPVVLRYRIREARTGKH